MQFLQLRYVLHVAKVCLEPIRVIKPLGLQEVQQCPQLLGVVLHFSQHIASHLQGGSCQQQLATEVNSSQSVAQLVVPPLQTVSFVHHQPCPRDGRQCGCLHDAYLEGGDENIELAFLRLPLVLQDVLSRVSRAVKHHDMHVCPSTNLRLPVRQCGEGSNDEEGGLCVVMVEDLLDEQRALHCFAETHFIGQNTISSVDPVPQQPVDSFDLVGSELIALRKRLIRIEFLELHKRRTLTGVVGLRIHHSIPTRDSLSTRLQMTIVLLNSLFVSEVIEHFPRDIAVRRPSPFH